MIHLAYNMNRLLERKISIIIRTTWVFNREVVHHLENVQRMLGLVVSLVTDIYGLVGHSNVWSGRVQRCTV